MSAQLPNHNAPVKTKLPASPTIDVGGLLGLLELVEKLRAARNSEQEEPAACPTEQFPPPLGRQTPPISWAQLPLPNRKRLVALLSKLLERQMATGASGGALLKEDGDDERKLLSS
jgi:hypothetical protein